MAETARLEEFQDLRLYGPVDSRTALRNALIQRADGLWNHAEDREREWARVTAGGEVLIFDRQAGEGIDSVGLFLSKREDGYAVTNIIPRVLSELSRKQYNAALQDFIKRIARPAADATGFRIEITEPYQSLDDWLPPQAAYALRRFSEAANKSTGSSHPLDRRRWFTFIIAAHRDIGNFDVSRLDRWLVEVEGWSEEKAQDLAIEFEFGLALLDEYDRSRD